MQYPGDRVDQNEKHGAHGDHEDGRPVPEPEPDDGKRHPGHDGDLTYRVHVGGQGDERGAGGAHEEPQRQPDRDRVDAAREDAHEGDAEVGHHLFVEPPGEEGLHRDEEVRKDHAAVDRPGQEVPEQADGQRAGQHADEALPAPHDGGQVQPPSAGKVDAGSVNK